MSAHRVPTRTGKMGRHFPVREFEQTGKVRENHTKYRKTEINILKVGTLPRWGDVCQYCLPEDGGGICPGGMSVQEGVSAWRVSGRHPHCEGVYVSQYALGRGLSALGVSAQGRCLSGRDVCLGGVCPRGVSAWRVSAQGVSAQGGVCPGGCLPRGIVCLGGCLPEGVSAQEVVCLGVWQTPPVYRMTDRCKKITLLQLHCGW